MISILTSVLQAIFKIISKYSGVISSFVGGWLWGKKSEEIKIIREINEGNERANKIQEAVQQVGVGTKREKNDIIESLKNGDFK